jgi:PGF-CTERM protein
MHESSLSGEMSEETNEELSGALDDLRSSYEETVPPSELEPAVEDARAVLTSAEFGGSQTESGSESEGTDTESGSETDDGDGMDGSGEDDESGSDGGEDAADSDSSGSDTESESGGQGMPGFTALAAVAALLGAAYLRR